MKIPVPLLAAFVFAFAPIAPVSAASGSSFDCSKASNKAEILVCGVPELSELDVRLDKHYRDARQAQNNRLTLRDSQRAWLRQRNQCENLECLRNVYQQRINELVLIASHSKWTNRATPPAETGSLASPGILPPVHTEPPKLTREQEVEFSTRSAAYHLANILNKEKAIATLPRKELAVLNAAGKINRLMMDKKESGELNQQQLMFVFSIVLARLGLLSQTANMPPAVIVCHLAESRSLENISKGLPPKAPNCRNDAYGPDIQVEILKETAKASWAANNKLVIEWVVDTLMYAQDIGTISQYGQAAAPKIEPRRP